MREACLSKVPHTMYGEEGNRTPLLRHPEHVHEGDPSCHFQAVQSVQGGCVGWRYGFVAL